MDIIRNNSWKWIVAFFLFLMFTMGMGKPADATGAGSEVEAAAEQLREWGMFHGTERGLELDRAPTRAEALVMLVRLLGKEEEARQTPGLAHPFTDVPAWADPVVAYAYQNGLASGVSATQFGANQPVTVAQYCTFVLRALGYDDGAGDFRWREAPLFIEQLGLGGSVQYGRFDEPFLRGHVADISYHALSLEVKGQGVTLFEKLAEEGVIPSPAEEEAVGSAEDDAELDGQPTRDSAIVVPVRIEPYDEWSPGSFYVYVSDDLLRERLPGVQYESYSLDDAFLFRHEERLDDYLLNYWGPRSPVGGVHLLNGERRYFVDPSAHVHDIRVLYDIHNNPVAYVTTADLSADRTTLTYHTRLPKHLEEIVDRAGTIAEQAVYIPHEWLYITELEYQVDFVEGEPIMATRKVVDIDLERLPEANRRITRGFQHAFAFRANRSPVSVEEFGDLTKFVQLNQQILFAYIRAGRPHSFPHSPLPLGNYSGKWSILFEFFLNDDDEILAYTYFTDDDYQVWAERIKQWTAQ